MTTVACACDENTTCAPCRARAGTGRPGRLVRSTTGSRLADRTHQ